MPDTRKGQPQRCWIGADAHCTEMSSTCGNCRPIHDHPDLRGHQPDPAHGHGEAAPEGLIKGEWSPVTSEALYADVGQGQCDDQCADAEVDHLVAEEHGDELTKRRAWPVVTCRPCSCDLAVDTEAAGDDRGSEHVEVTGHDDAP